MAQNPVNSSIGGLDPKMAKMAKMAKYGVPGLTPFWRGMGPPPLVRDQDWPIPLREGVRPGTPDLAILAILAIFGVPGLIEGIWLFPLLLAYISLHMGLRWGTPNMAKMTDFGHFWGQI